MKHQGISIWAIVLESKKGKRRLTTPYRLQELQVVNGQVLSKKPVYGLSLDLIRRRLPEDAVNLGRPDGCKDASLVELWV